MGSVVIVPVLRPGGPAVADGPSRARLALSGRRRRASGRPATPSRCFRTSSSERARWSCSGFPRRGRRGAVVVDGRLTDPARAAAGPRQRRGGDVRGAGQIARAACGGGRRRIPGVQLSAAGDTRTADSLARAARAVIAAAGVLAGRGRGCPPTPARTSRRSATRALRVHAAIDGFLETDLAPGDTVQARSPLGRVVPTLPGPPSIVTTRVDGLVVEAARRRAGARRDDAVRAGSLVARVGPAPGPAP